MTISKKYQQIVKVKHLKAGIVIARLSISHVSQSIVRYFVR